MNFKDSKRVMKKIKTLMDSFESIGEELSDIELSLLDRYIDDLRESLPRPEPKEAKVKELQENVVVEKNNIKGELQAEPDAQEDKPQDESPEIEIQELVKVDNIKDEVKPNIPTSIKEDIASDQRQSLNEKMNVTEDTVEGELFQKIEATDLSSKLGLKAVSNIEKALSINERILTQNELFDGNGELMKTVISTLDGLENYDQAIDFLKTGVAKDLKWNDDEKKKKAAGFLKIVQRRYL